VKPVRKPAAVAASCIALAFGGIGLGGCGGSDDDGQAAGNDANEQGEPGPKKSERADEKLNDALEEAQEDTEDGSGDLSY